MTKTATAIVTQKNDLYVVSYQNAGSYLTGTQYFGNINAALRFCRLNHLAVSVR